MTEGQQKEHQKDEEVLIDFSTLGSKLKGWWKKDSKPAEDHRESQSEHHPKQQQHEKKTDDEIHLDWNKLKSAWNTHSRWLIPVVCILLAMSFSIYLRTMPLRLPIADDWAQTNVQSFYQRQVQQQIERQYPNLPEQNKEALAAKEWEKFYQQNQQLIDSQQQQLAEQFRNNFRDGKGFPYLLGIDPYYYYRQTYYVLTYGFPGTEIRDGKVWDTYRMAPLGRETEWNFHHWFAAYWHRFLNIFGDYPLMYTFFFVGTLFSALTVIPAFFIGRILTRNNAGGFFTAMLIAVSAFFVARTTGESSDTDVYAVFFPVLIAWLFLQSREQVKLRPTLLWLAAAGFLTGVFAFAWTGWWYIAVFIIATILFELVLKLLAPLLPFLSPKEEREISIKERLRSLLMAAGVYVLTTIVAVNFLTSFRQSLKVLFGPQQFIRLKAVAVTTYWPNIKTTVAELNVPAFSHVLSQFDGQFYFALALLGIVFLAFSKDQLGRRNWALSFFLALWFAASSYATTKGVRFILQLTPAFSIALGALLGTTWLYASRWLSKHLQVNRKIASMLVFLVLSLLLISPVKSGYSQAFNSVSSMNDWWYSALTKIKQDAPPDAIITSWWDFGHWFKAIAERSVTFDGGTQTGYGAYWVGKALLTDNETVAVGIIRMLNCGQNNAFNEFTKTINDPPRQIDILNEIIVQERAGAVETLHRYNLTPEQIAAVLQYTHCPNPPVDYFITSDDMIGKSGVWGHFGSWDYHRAALYQEIKRLEPTEGIATLTSSYNFSPEKAEETYQEIQSTDADRWIAPWPSYFSGVQGCEKLPSSELRCRGSLQGNNFVLRIDINSTTAQAYFENNPEVTVNSLVYVAEGTIKEQKFSGKTAGFSLALIPAGEGYQFITMDPQQANSLFTKLFFLNGQGLHCFRLFDNTEYGNGRIMTWIVDYECGGS